MIDINKKALKFYNKKEKANDWAKSSTDVNQI